jgi:hypothetical protein
MSLSRGVMSTEGMVAPCAPSIHPIGSRQHALSWSGGGDNGGTPVTLHHASATDVLLVPT